MRNRKALAIPAAVLLVIVLLVVVVIIWTRGGTPVAKEKAVDDFRRTTTTTGDADEDDVDTREALPPIPRPGIYAYASSGNQEIKFGPLPADPRILPDEIVAGVTHSSAPEDLGERIPDVELSNCFDFELKVFAEHEEVMTSCVAWASDEGEVSHATIAQHLIRMRMGPVVATAHLECEELLVMSPLTPQSGIPCVLRLTGAPVEVNADLIGSVSVGEVEEIEIEGETIAARPVRIAYDADSKVTGTWGETLWVSEEGWLPLRFDRDINLVGPATIIERSELLLKSLEPAT